MDKSDSIEGQESVHTAGCPTGYLRSKLDSSHPVVYTQTMY